MILGKPKKTWRITMMTPNYRDEECIGRLIEGEDFWMFAPSDTKQDTIIYPNPQDVKDVIKLTYGRSNKYAIGHVETFF